MTFRNKGAKSDKQTIVQMNSFLKYLMQLKL